MSIESLAWTRELSAWLAGTDIQLLELTGPGTSLRLRRGGGAYIEAAAPVPSQQPTGAAGTTLVTAPSVGLLRHRHPLREAALAPVGTRVRSGQPLALLQIGTLLLAVPAGCDGVVARHVVADGATVGYGDALVELRE